MKDTPDTKDQNNDQNTDGNDNNQQDTNHDGSGGKQENNGENVVMTRERFDKRINELKAQAKRSAVGEVLELFEVDNLDQAKSIILSHKAAIEADLSELDKAQAANATLQSELANRQSDYNAVLVNNAVILESPKHKVSTERIPALMKLMDTSTMSVKDGAVTGVEDAIKKAVEDNPFLLYQDQEADDSKGDGKLPPQGTSTTNQQRLRDQLGKVNEDDKKKKRNTPKYSM